MLSHVVLLCFFQIFCLWDHSDCLVYLLLHNQKLFLLHFLSGSDLVDYYLLSSLYVPVVIQIVTLEIWCKFFLQTLTCLQNACTCCTNHSVPVVRCSWPLSGLSDNAWLRGVTVAVCEWLLCFACVYNVFIINIYKLTFICFCAYNCCFQVTLRFFYKAFLSKIYSPWCMALKPLIISFSGNSMLYWMTGVARLFLVMGN